MPENGGEWTHFTQADLGLQSGQVLSMEFDNGGLWFTTAYTPTVVGNGTGVHYLRFNGEQPAATHYTYRDSSTTLTTLNYKFIAADRSGNVWFPGDDPRVARLNTDGTWTQFHNAGGKPFGNFGFAGVAADSKNRVYFAPQNARPVAYDVNIEQWIDLPSMSYTDYFYYGAYADPEDGKWFYGAFGIYYLDPENSAWTWYDSSNTELFPDYRVDGVLMDDGGNAWFMTWYGIALMKKDPDGGESTWFKFSRGDDSGYTGGYRVYQDDAGQIWNANKQKFNAEDNTWADAADTSAFDQRNLRFLNGRVSAGMDLSDALEPKPVLDERNMTIDSRGTIYFSGGSGIMAFGPPKGDLDGSGIVDLTDAVLAGKVLVDEAAGIYANGDVSGDFKIGLAEIIFILQRVSGLR